MNEFQEYKLSDLGEWLGGGTPSKSKDEYWDNGSIPWVSPKDMKRFRIDSSKDLITALAIEKTSAKLIPEQSILIVTRSGILQRYVPIAINEVPVTINQDLKAIIPNGKVRADYLANLLRLQNNRILHECAKVGTTVESLGTNLLKGYKVHAPDKDLQDKIMSVIDAWDEAITRTDKLIQAKKRYKKGLMQRLLSGKVRFPEFIETDQLQKTRFGEYPSDWEILKIQDICEEEKNKVGESNNVTVLSCTKHDGLVNSDDYFDRQVYSDDITKYKLVHEGDFAYATNHIEEGSIGYNANLGYGAISPMYTVFKADKTKIIDEYLYLILKTENYRRIFEIFTNGTVNRRGSLRWKDFKKIQMPVPKIGEQKKIAEVLGTLTQEIELLKDEVKLLKKQKKGLMQKLLTGKVRVK